MRKADNLSPSCAVVTKSGNLNFLEPSGPLRVCNGTALPFFYLEGSGPNLTELTYRHMTAETEDNHTEPQLKQPLARQRFEPGTSRIELGSAIP